jgi:hypothetical protein
MAYATTTISFTDGLQVTSARLNEIVSGFRIASDSVDGTSVTLTAGVLSVGTLSAANLGADSVTTVKILDLNVTTGKIADLAVTAGKLAADAVTAAKILDGAVTFAKTLTADRAVQADMQSETASHFVSPDVLKFHPGVAKAYGTVSFENGVTTITGGYNITSASDGGTTRVVTMAITMANTNYIVLATGNGGGSQYNCTAKTTTTFTLEGPAEAASRSCSFVVFGQRA